MGHDIKYQSMPDDCSILQWARHDFEISEYLPGFALSVKGILPPHADEKLQTFAKEAQDVARQYSGLENRKLYDGRRVWDTLHYLLSETRRQSSWDAQPDFGDFPTRIIRGGNVLCTSEENNFNLSGVFQPTRYMPADEVHQAVAWMDAITQEQLIKYWNAKVMRERFIYKFVDQADWALEGFGELKSFYKLAADHNEGIVTAIF